MTALERPVWLHDNRNKMDEIAEILGDRIFSEDAERFYAILDGASVPDLLNKLEEYRPEYECLYRGELKPDLAEVAPYLIALDRESEFTTLLLEKGWGKHWGIFIASNARLAALRRHFRGFLIVYDPKGKPLYFRYYDPRVLRVYLPTCDPQELETIFGPVVSYALEAEDPNILLRFRAPNGKLQQEKVTLDVTH